MAGKGCGEWVWKRRNGCGVNVGNMVLPRESGGGRVSAWSAAGDGKDGRNAWRWVLRDRMFAEDGICGWLRRRRGDITVGRCRWIDLGVYPLLLVVFQIYVGGIFRNIFGLYLSSGWSGGNIICHFNMHLRMKVVVGLLCTLSVLDR